MNVPAVTLAKITQPLVEGVLLREELFKRLDDCREKPITWVVGPGGSGKTTLISSYLKSRDLPCLWFQIDAGDSDLATFFYYLGLAGKKASPRKRKPLPLLTPEYLYGIHEFSRNFFGDLFSRLKTPCIIVFDNYQEVSPESPLHQTITEGLSRLPEGISLIMASRSAPPPDYSRYRMNRQMETLDWSDLRLSFKECQQILSINKRVPISSANLKELYQLVDGWAAGLLLLFESNGIHQNPDCGLPSGSNEEIFDYFACEVFERQDLITREFLIKTAFMPYMTPDMAKKLTENQSAGHILSGLNRQNHFTEKSKHPHITYQFHPLFREFLLKKAQDYYGGEDLTNLKQQAARILLDSDQQEAAVKLLHEAGDWTSLISLIISQAESLIQQGRNLVLEAWIKMLPENLVSDNPWLIFWLAVSRVPFDPNESKGLFEKAFHGFVENDDRVGLFLAWSGVSDSIFFCFTRFHDYDHWLEVFEEIREKYTPYPSPEIEVRMTTSVLNALVFRQPFHKDYKIYIDRAADLVETDIDMAAKVQLYQALFLSQIFARNLIKAEFYINAFRSFTESNPVPPMALVLQKQSEAFFLWLAARFEECHGVIADNFKICSEFGIHLFDFFLLNYEISAALSEGDVEGAEPFIEKMLANIDHMNDWAKSYFYSQLSWRDLLQGDLVRAEMYQTLGHKTAANVGMPTTFGLHKVWWAFTNHQLGHHDKADTYLAESVEYYKKINLESTNYDFYLNKAYIDLERGREAEGLQALKDCFRVARKYGCVNSYNWQAPMMAKLCARALQEGFEPDYVRHLIRLRGLVPEDPLVAGEEWPWPVKIFTFGRFSLLLDDKEFSSSGKAKQKQLALLKVIIALGGRKISDTKIADAMWPDTDGDVQMQSLHTTLHRLRKLLGNNETIIYSNGIISLNNKLVWVDVWAFERFAAKSESADKDGHADVGLAQLSRKLCRIYSGPFLAESVDEIWSITMREQMLSRFLRTAERLADSLTKQKLWQESIDLYEKALDNEPLVELFYQRLIVIYQNLGRKDAALNLYDRCCKNLHAGLQIGPSRKTSELYQKLLSS